MTEVKSYLEAIMSLDEAPLKLDPGQVVFSAGDAGREMFIVRSGSVELRIGDTLLVTLRNPQGVFCSCITAWSGTDRESVGEILFRCL